MFPEKIKITDDLIKLIIDTRKKYNLTAYQLSEKIGKNKSWLPNIENKRTKNISKSDLYLLFKEFADEENLKPEQYIVKYLPRDTTLELEDGTSAPCFYVKEMLGVYDWNEANNLPLEEREKEDDFRLHEVKANTALQEKEVSASIYRLSSILTQRLNLYDLKQKQEYIKYIDTMTTNFENDFEETIEIYGNSFCPADPLEYDTSVKEKYLKDLHKMQSYIDSTLWLMHSRVFIYSFIEEVPSDMYNFFYKIRNWDSLSDSEDEKLFFALEDIKNYHFGIYFYIEKCEVCYNLHNIVTKIDYPLLFSKLDEMFTSYIKVANINYTYELHIPADSVTHEEIEAIHSKTDKILFDIEKEVRSKYNNFNSVLSN